jgi:hypothetical protein
MTALLGRGVRYGTYLKNADGELIQIGELEWNTWTQEFIDHVAGMIRGSGPEPISNWYMFLFENNFHPTKAVKASDLPGVVGECTAYEQTQRPAWAHAYDDTSVIDNMASLASFKMTADKRIYGAGIISSNVKGGNTGMVMSIARFSTPRDLKAGDDFALGGVMTMIPTSM